jgi:hypothetical protein
MCDDCLPLERRVARLQVDMENVQNIVRKHEATIYELNHKLHGQITLVDLLGYKTHELAKRIKLLESGTGSAIDIADGAIGGSAD